VKVGDLVRFKPEDWGTPLEDRPLGIVVSEPYRISPHPERDNLVVEVRFNGDSTPYVTGPETLEVVSGARN